MKLDHKFIKMGLIWKKEINYPKIMHYDFYDKK